ncbi:MAG: YcxB family protein, partial [Acidimicrobiia bacterium]
MVKRAVPPKPEGGGDPASPAVTVSFMLSEGEMERAMEEHVQASSWRLILPVVVAALAVIGAAAVLRSQPKLGTPALMAATLLAVYRQSIYRKLGEAYVKRDTPAAGKRTYTFRDDGITVLLPGARGRVDWSVWTKVVETEEFYLLLA